MGLHVEEAFDVLNLPVFDFIVLIFDHSLLFFQDNYVNSCLKNALVMGVIASFAKHE
ncbi:MAG: hypothetical protein IT544_03680 [Rhodobacteraceae bacterium]|nr:hypothetical protein [Paracoccaceae bacterium]